MDRTAALQAAHQAQAKLREAEEAIATASAVLQGWCSDRIRDPPNTVMGQVRRALVPDPSQLSQEMQENDLQTDPENHLHPSPTSAPLLSHSSPHSDE